MQSEHTERLADLVASALDCAVSERAQFLSDVCGDDVALRQEAESLLRFEENARDFIEIPAYKVALSDAPNGVSEPIWQEAILESEPTELVIAQDVTLESEPTELVIAQEPIFEIEAAEPVTGQEPIHQREEIIEFEPELLSSEIERSDHELTVAAAFPEEPKPRVELVPAPAKKASDSFEIPRLTARERTPPRSVKFVWMRRAAIIGVVLFAIAMVIALNSARQNSKSAQHQRDVAQAERSRAERINIFLQRTLYFSDQNVAPVWPVAQKRNVTATELLDRIVPQVQSELADQPDVRGEVLRRIGNTYASQGDHDAAEKILRAALQAQTAFYGEQSAQAIETMVDLGVLLYRREKFAEADGFLEKGTTFLRKLNQSEGGRHNAVKLAYVLDQLGGAKFYQGDVKAGRAVLEEALQVATQAQPKELDRSVLTNIKTDLGGLLVLFGELRKGEVLLQESLAESRALTNAPQWERAMTLQMLGELALARNRGPEAEERFLAAEGIYRETLGEKNLYFARNLERRASVSLLENDLSSAEELAQRSLSITKECSPENKLPWTDSMVTLSSILINQGRVAEGEDYLRKTIRICEEQPARNYAAIGLAKIRLSQLLLSQQRFTEAENLAFEAHNQAQQNLEPQDPLRKATANNLIEIYVREGKNDAARGVK